MESCKPFFIKYKILTLSCVYILEICKFVRSNPQLFETEKPTSSDYSMPPENRLLLPKTRLKMLSNNTLMMAVKIYNKLTNDLKTIKSDIRFIQNLKRYLTDKAYYSIDEYLNDNYYPLI